MSSSSFAGKRLGYRWFHIRASRAHDQPARESGVEPQAAAPKWGPPSAAGRTEQVYIMKTTISTITIVITQLLLLLLLLLLY